MEGVEHRRREGEPTQRVKRDTLLFLMSYDLHDVEDGMFVYEDCEL